MPTLTYTPIASQTVTTTVAGLTFSSIPSTYTDLVVITSTRGTVDSHLLLQFNADTATNYSSTYYYATAGAGYTARQTNTFGCFVGRTATATSDFATGVTHIQSYSDTTTNKTILSQGASPAVLNILYSGTWRNTAAITSLTISGNTTDLLPGSTITLYGIKAA
jgi:hypothetical protein